MESTALKKRMTAREARRQLRKLNARPLSAKVDRARDVIAATLAQAGTRAVVSFSGGRDSTVLAELVRQQAPEIPLVYIDTGLADPKLTAWITTYGGAQLVHLPPVTDPEETWRREGCLPIGAKTSTRNYVRDNPELRIGPAKCCHVHKARPMNAWLREHGCRALFFGARGDDSARHAFKLMHGEAFPSPHGWTLSYPLLTWTQADVLTWLRERMPEYPLAYARNEELGCRACAINLARWPNQMQKLRQADPAYHRHLMVDVGYGVEILMLRFAVTRRGAQQLVEAHGWDGLIDAGHLDRIPQAKKGLR